MLSGFLKASGWLILKVVYGKKFAEKASDSVGLMILLSLANVFWLLCILFLATGISANDTVFCIVAAVVYPVAITIWAFFARKKRTPFPTEDSHTNTQIPEDYEINKFEPHIEKPENTNFDSTYQIPSLKVRYCRRCGFELIVESRFCSRCGNEIETEDHL